MSSVRPIGRSLRLLIGGVVVVQVFLLLGRLHMATIGLAVGAVMGLALFYTGVHLGLTRLQSRRAGWIGAVLLLAPLVGVFSLGGVSGQLGTLLFLGGSLIIAGIRADPGCEVLSLPGLLTGRRTYIPCLFFSPLDWLENRARRDNDATDTTKHYSINE